MQILQRHSSHILLLFSLKKIVTCYNSICNGIRLRVIKIVAHVVNRYGIGNLESTFGWCTRYASAHVLS